MSGFESEIPKPFAEAPRELSAFFREGVERLIHDNLDLIVSDAWGTKAAELLHLIDKSPPRGELKYHYAYHLFDHESQITKHGILVAEPKVIRPAPIGSYAGFRLWPWRKNSGRHYFDNGQGLGLVALRYQRGRIQILDVLEGYIEDPSHQNDPLDSELVTILKADLLSLQRSTPVRTSGLTDLTRKIISS